MTTNTHTPPSTTLVLGGTGKTGRRVARRLSESGRAVRIGSRSGRPRFDWQDEATWEPVLAGADSAYIAYAPDVGLPGADAVVGRFARAAAAAGVTRLVLLSGRGEPGALRSEQALRAAGADWTVVRSSFFMQNFTEDFLAAGVADGEVAFPAGQTGEPFVDAEDVAAVAAAALLEPGHSGRVYEVTGPRPLTFAQALAEIGAAAGLTPAYRPLTTREFAAGLVADGADPAFAASLSALLGEVLDGRNTRPSGGVRQALGREPCDFADFARAAAAAGAWRTAPAEATGA
ncbi:Rossmann-fold NAD(P)-binding domain-containing protein [Streptomonospora wellingtoniae]|uniref:NAD(P)H-binding protein n=1 Tax=Streptomonospora wellingtoniae TaxID=3075544 RepID=A0ABU2L0B7_9ACTN|nr:NAD(P)H-binding protein [Streptomonospora sp. DSM 45055]MDT0304962.1 NAD(P)H-binding protein [Streptomonospora sp. DSM 45055]